MASPAIDKYYTSVQKIRDYGGSGKETAMHRACWTQVNPSAKPSDPTIAEKFNTYRFADYMEKVIDLLKRVTTVSVGTMEVVRGMEKAVR